MDNTNKNQWPGWETGRLIGRGSFGAVYEIQRDVLGDIEKAALKVISIPQNDSDIDEMYNDGYDEESVTSTFQSHLKSIVSEYSLMRKMNGSANVVNCDDIRYVQHDNGIGWDIFIKMELLTPLGKALPAEIPEATVIKIAKDLCAALELCKKHEIVHRDIKPQNIFVSPNGDYKLGDFGIAKTVEKTSGGTKIGTYKYMAPEVYNNQPYGHTADIYSLGLVLYWMLNERRMPFLPLPPVKLSASLEEQARMRRFMGEQLPAPTHGSNKLKQIVLKACAYDPKARYHSAREMLDDLDTLGVAKTVPVSIPIEAAPEMPIITDKDRDEDATVGMGIPGPTVSNEEKVINTPTYAVETAGQIPEEDATVGMGLQRPAAKTQQDSVAIVAEEMPEEAPAPAPAMHQNLDKDATVRMGVRNVSVDSCKESDAASIEVESEDVAAEEPYAPVSPAFMAVPDPESDVVGESKENLQPAPESEKRKKTPLIIAAVLAAILIAVMFIPVYGGWTEWSQTAPASGDKRIETIDQYSYRSKEVIELEQGIAPPASAELINQRENWSAYSEWSDWQTNVVGDFEIAPDTMTVYAENFQPENSTEGDPSYTTDGDPNTHWHTVWSDSGRDTHYLMFTFNELTSINGMCFLQRTSGVNGVVTRYDLYVRESETAEWTLIVDDGVLKADPTWQKVEFDAVNALQVKFQVVDAQSDSTKKYAAAAEIRFTVETFEIETRTQYRSRSVSVEDIYSEWSDWSNWDIQAPPDSDLCQMEVGSAYEYDVYRYFCLNCGESNSDFDLIILAHARKHGIPEEKINVLRSALVGNCSVAEGLAAVNWSYEGRVLVSINTELSVNTGTSPYEINYGGTVYYTNTPAANRIEGRFRYRTRTLEQQTVYSEWSAFSDTPITENANTEVETRVQYRYRTREMTTICQYSVWSEWSEWQTTPVEQNEYTEIKQDTFYRYAERYFLWEKLFGLIP